MTFWEAFTYVLLAGSAMFALIAVKEALAL